MQLLTAKTCYTTLGAMASATALRRWHHTSATAAGAVWAAFGGAGATSSGSEKALKGGQILGEAGQSFCVGSLSFRPASRFIHKARIQLCFYHILRAL